MSDGPFYWDASAVLSMLVPDQNSRIAAELAHRKFPHIIASVGAAEVYSVLVRMERGRVISPDDAQTARGRFDSGSWRYVAVTPARALLQGLARRWSLRGAGLWHLAAAITLRKDQVGLQFLTFDAALVKAARGEELSAT